MCEVVSLGQNDGGVARADPSGRILWPAAAGIGVGLCALWAGCCAWDLSTIANNVNRDVAAISAGWPAGYSTGDEGTPADALQHCMGACEANQHPGSCKFSFLARMAVNSFETCQGTQFDTLSDLDNNAIGFSIKGDCRTGCLERLRAGALLCASSTPTTVFFCPRLP